MFYRNLGDAKVSELTLGTVQFGLNYGIANVHGKPNYDTAMNILRLAFENGVNSLDTAAAYGDSEEILGRALAELRPPGDLFVTTKVPRLPEGISSAEAETRVCRSVEESLRKLRLPVLSLCLFHSEEDARNLDILATLKEKGLARWTGISVDHVAIAKAALLSGAADACQFPFNAFDKRPLAEKVFAAARDRGAGIFIRSVYLQGLMLMPDEKIMPELAEVILPRKRLLKLAEDAGLSLAEMATRYALSFDGVTSVLVGVDTLEQLETNLRYFDRGPLDAALIEAIHAAVPELPERILRPALWPKPKTAADQKKT